MAEDMPATFITYAANILGDTNRGLSGAEIVNLTTAYAVEFNLDLPNSRYPFPNQMTNKRTALFQNLMVFTPEQRFKIIKELCDHLIERGGNSEPFSNLRLKLFKAYNSFDTSGDAHSIEEAFIATTRHWLDKFPDSLSLYDSALRKYGYSEFHRNVLDDLRLSLEILLKNIFGNNKSLEKQMENVGSFVKTRGGSSELSNMFLKLLDYYSKYQNSYVKHNDDVIEEEIEFVVEITSSFMKHLIRLNSRSATTL